MNPLGPRGHERAPRIRVRHPRFPWPSALAALAVATWFLFFTDPELQSFYQVPGILFSQEAMFSLLAIFILLMLFDLRRFQHRASLQKRDLKRVNEQMDELWNRNRDLQIKAHTYSGHADKLKLFISDKLLEYIEYDEKFLHFKGIAAEVRHNGVISFDKVQTALLRAAEQARGQSVETAGTANEQGKMRDDSLNDFDNALAAMRYLWDLLDLSTADNLALHIGNLLCECEEHYCQRLLNPDSDNELPYEPTFDPRHAAWRALGLVRPDPPPLTTTTPPAADSEDTATRQHPDDGDGATDRPPALSSVYALDDEQWHVRLGAAGELLGNENHLVLLLDNLLKNAQFFSRKHSSKRGIPNISFSLEETQGQTVFRVYNRGPHIQEDDRERLFQLGYSTRRSRDHHGRGLGLYFVNEIVKAYEGHIHVRNIHNVDARYQLDIELENGQTLTHTAEVMVQDGRPVCLVDEADDEKVECRAETGDPTTRDSQGWTLPGPARHIDVSADHSPQPRRLSGFEGKGKQDFPDPAHPERPHWRISYQARRRNPRLTFEPLNINGVEFEVRIPTAQHRLDSGETALEEDMDAEVERLEQRFGHPLR
ncbi:ATP-binding protein [Natronospira bacteriovora]|uniref:histidine kinase n=1 Tax=Natronospira bacteriovora TaxID=3069753 RepID=A0ABU0W9D9_9GAMM|nr:ATP-binding protein [Natronospira sp. AB-CW4]MDQ2069600.1 ATP-binding protein [Natronospira sp. AB-CW4]